MAVMGKVLLLFACIILVSSQDFEDKTVKHWAVIVAGSSGWENYRHQADVCHAYQVLQKHGMPAERIITLMFDDLANNEYNPTPGIVINHPDGDDVYKGVNIDYRQRDVTPEVFLAVLTGNKTAVANKGTGRVLESGAKDHVFVYFADHGAPGIIAFPESELKARDLMTAINYMHDKKMYQQMVIYIEACESGSMFNHILPDDIDVYATTAANPKESSYACYFDQKRKTYLGDLYSVKWLEDSDKENLKKESLHKQFKIVQKETNTSHVRQYGDKKMADEMVSDFQSGVNSAFNPENIIELPQVPFDAVPSEDVKLEIMSRSMASAETEEEKYILAARMKSHIEERRNIRKVFQHVTDMIAASDPALKEKLSIRPELTDFDCYEGAVASLQKYCFKLSETPYALQQLYQLVSLCESSIPLSHIEWSIQKTCQPDNTYL